MVARDSKPKGKKDRQGLLAAMPPLEAKRLLFAIAASGKRQWRGERWARTKLMFIDIKKAHLNGKIGEGEFMCASPLEGWWEGGEATCWRLKRWLYGMRLAASA